MDNQHDKELQETIVEIKEICRETMRKFDEIKQDRNKTNGNLTNDNES